MNLQPAVLETAALPVELHPYATHEAPAAVLGPGNPNPPYVLGPVGDQLRTTVDLSSQRSKSGSLRHGRGPPATALLTGPGMGPEPADLRR